MEETQPIDPRFYEHMRWVRQVEACDTNDCQHGFPIRGLRQAGSYVYVIHDPDTRHTCSFRGALTPEMEAFYNA